MPGAKGVPGSVPIAEAFAISDGDSYRLDFTTAYLPVPRHFITHDYFEAPFYRKRTSILQAAQQIGSIMKFARILPAVALFSVLGATDVMADCQIADAKLEETILKKPELRVPANRQIVRDLRSLRDAAFTLWSYGRHADCERLLANIRELLAQPLMSTLGGNDEEEADKQISALEPKVQRGAAKGHRDEKGAKPLVSINELAPGLRADEIIGAEVRSSDDKIIGEVRNVVFGTRDRQDYAIVASGGFFTTGKDSIVVPIRFLQVSEERTSFFLPIRESQVRTVPLMPDQDYTWLADEAWRARNDAFFARP